MNPLAVIFAVARSDAHKSGVVSTAVTVPGSIAAYIAIRLADGYGSPLSMEEVFAVYMAGPAISSYVLETIRKAYRNALGVYTDIMTAFQRDTSEPRSEK